MTTGAWNRNEAEVNFFSTNPFSPREKVAEGRMRGSSSTNINFTPSP
jgi:hypothetical protein